MSSPRPWTCSDCGARLLWKRTTVDCPTHGVLAVLPARDDDKEQQQ